MSVDIQTRFSFYETRIMLERAFTQLPSAMPIVVVRGTPGVANTKVYGLPKHEADKMFAILRPGPVSDQKDELTFYNSPVNLMNQLEYHFGYRVVTCTAQGQSMQPIWTLTRPY